MIRVVPFQAKHHVRAYYCQNCFKHLVAWVRADYPNFMLTGLVNTAYYATMIGLRAPSTDEGRAKEMDERVFGFTASKESDTEFIMFDVDDPTPLSAFIPDDPKELDEMMRESRKLMIHE